MTLRLFIALIMISAIPVTNAWAQQTNNQSQPLEITADQTLEWHRADQKFIANGNVIVIQGDTEIRTDRLVANYRESEGENFDIYKLTATGSVRILSNDSQATGDLAIYNVDTGLAEITGDNLQMISVDGRMTAQDRFEYYVESGRLEAIGDVVLFRQQDTLSAEQITAFFEEGADGKRALSNAKATGGVIIQTPTETLTGDEGTYDAATDMAEVTGDVVIRRGLNRLEGSKAEINLATNVSKMQGGPTSSDGNRVRGVFFPGQDNSGLESITEQ